MDEPVLTDGLEAEIGFAHELVEIASKIARSFVGESLRVDTKKDGTPVTQVDVAIEGALRDAVSARFPKDQFLGEESGGSVAGGRVWVVDPIDGTKNFVDGIQLWGTLVALLIEGTPMLGVVDISRLGERYEAIRGGGARMNGEPIAVSDARALADAFVVHSGIEEWVDGPRWPGFLRVVTACRRTRGLSDSWGHMLVARGAADVVLEHEPCGVWDWAAVQVILEEAGGTLTTLDGDPPFPGCTLVGTNGALHADVLKRLHATAASE